MQKTLILLFISINTFVFGQNCDCGNEFSYIKNYMENNYVGFKDKVNAKNKTAYAAFVETLKTKLKDAASNQCLTVISEYLDYFKDGHVYIETQPNLDSAALKNFAKQTEQIQLDKEQIRVLKKATGIEGVYFSEDTIYKVALLKNKTKYRDYAGIILEAKYPSWKANQVKFELKQISTNEYRYTVYNRNHVPHCTLVKITGNTFEGWLKENAILPKNKVNDDKLVEWRKLNEATNYIKISTFSEINAQNIDSLFNVHKSELDSTANLIIDLRDNSGGSDYSYNPITKYLYTNPVVNTGGDVYSTEGNIKGWEFLLTIPDIPDDAKTQVQAIIKQMKEHKNSLVTIVPDNIDSSKTPLKFPQKIVILINRECASSTEEFLLLARQSKKVILAGEHTSGILDYANVRGTNFSCMPFILSYATTKSKRVDRGQGIDNIGIIPDIKLSENQDWINEALKILEKK